MHATAIVVESAADKWRAHCLSHPQRFRSLSGAAATRKRTERWEAELVEQLLFTDLSLKTRADAFRAIMELRGCSGRDVSTFFGVSPDVVILGLSLLEIPATAEADAAKAA